MTMSNTRPYLTFSMPLEGLTDAKLLNLERLIASNASLIQKSLGAARLTVVRLEDKLEFPWFDRVLEDDEIMTYLRFITALCMAAKGETKTRMVCSDDEKPVVRLAFRIFLLNLGFRGPESEAERELLLRPLADDFAGQQGDEAHSNQSTPVALDEATYDQVEQMMNSYAMMAPEEQADWSRDAAREWVKSQRESEISWGLEPVDYDADDVYETILEFIVQDAEDGTVDDVWGTDEEEE